jgi:molybdopterin-biosynthesis enzyme MoeA-like protein
MPADDDRTEVLTSLPRSRPQRRSTKRGGGAGPSSDGATAAAAAPAAEKPVRKPRAAVKPKAAARAKAPARPRAAAEEPGARPVEPPSSADVLQSAVRAAGELAQVGSTIGREALKSVFRRIRP